MMNDLGLTVFDLKNLKGKRTVKFVQVDTLDQAIAAKEFMALEYFENLILLN